MVHGLLITTGLAVVAILRVIGNALYQPDDDERVSTWSIRKRDARIFFFLLYGLWILGAVALAYAQYASAPPRVIEWATPPPHVGDGAAYVVIQRFGGVVVPLMAAALLLTPMLTGTGRILMSLSRFINDKILDPIIEAKAVAPRIEHRLAEARAKAWTEAWAEAQAETIDRSNAQWAGWLARRDAALAQGLEFNEPRPDEINPSER